MRYILGRLGFLIFSIWAAITINFVLPRMMPGNPAEVMMAKFQGKLSPQSLVALEKLFGIDNKPFLQQYFEYLKSMVTGHWGLSITNFPVKVTDLIGQSLPWTLGMVGIATIISFVIGTLLGVYIAWRRGGILDSVLPISTMFLQAVPYFWMALVLLFFLGFKWSWFPMSGGYSTDITPGWTLTFLQDALYHAVLPGTTILLGSLSGWIVGMRNVMINTLGEDYVTFAEAKGISVPRLMFAYAARNAILPQITAFGISLGSVVAGAFFTEYVFSYPGVGNLLVNSVMAEDYPLLQGTFLIVAVTVLVVNFLVDILYARLDPRVRTGGAPS